MGNLKKKFFALYIGTPTYNHKIFTWRGGVWDELVGRYFVWGSFFLLISSRRCWSFGKLKPWREFVFLARVCQILVNPICYVVFLKKKEKKRYFLLWVSIRICKFNQNNIYHSWLIVPIINNIVDSCTFFFLVQVTWSYQQCKCCKTIKIFGSRIHVIIRIIVRDSL